MKKFAFLGIIFVCMLGIGLKSLGQNPQAPIVPPPLDDMPLESEPELPQPPASVTEGATTTPMSPEMMDPFLEGFFEDVGYAPTDRRDPFLPYLSPTMKLTQAPDVPLEPLQKFALTQLKLVGIIWDVGRPKALVEYPSGRSHIIIENTKVGQEMGYVAAIREGEIIVVEQLVNAEGRKSFQTKILKLSSTKGVAR